MESYTAFYSTTEERAFGTSDSSREKSDCTDYLDDLVIPDDTGITSVIPVYLPLKELRQGTKPNFRVVQTHYRSKFPPGFAVS